MCKLVCEEDFMEFYIEDFVSVIDMEVIVKVNLKLGIDLLGGVGIGYWLWIVDKYGLDIIVVNDVVDL